MEMPHVFKSDMRKKYFEILTSFSENEDLILDLSNYKEAVFLVPGKGFFNDARTRVIAGIIESNSKYGEPDDLSNELTLKGLNARIYEGLQIVVVDRKYAGAIQKIADYMSASLKEEVIVQDKSPEAESLIKSVIPKS